MEERNPELDHFRQKWREEVTARRKGKERAHLDIENGSSSQTSGSRAPMPKPMHEKPVANEADSAEVGAYHDLENLDESRRLGNGNENDDSKKKTIRGKDTPLSALDHYETAVEKENQGNLGESLKHYRAAFRLDDRVDQVYKNKYFPPPSTKTAPSNPNPSGAAVTVPSTSHHSLQGSSKAISALIGSFSGLRIECAPPTIEGTAGLPCYIAQLPNEVLIEVLEWLAIIDVSAFARTALVCKQFAYLFATEERIWQRLCIGHEVGFAAMHYDLGAAEDGEDVMTIHGHKLGGEQNEDEAALESKSQEITKPLSPTSEQTLAYIASTQYGSSWARMFRSRPRIRFNGCYISTNNYVRAGQSSPSQVTWNTPVHIVTYYRYLRFYRDGTVLSLLSSTEPIDVVHHLTKDNLNLHKDGAASGLPSAFMKSALRGKWMLSGPEVVPGSDQKEGEVYVETEGANPAYIYKMHLTLLNSGKKTKNNKLSWRSFFTYNQLTDSWGELSIPHDKGYIWSRVRSYGMGG